MSSPVSVLSRDDTVEHAARLMLERRFSAVPLLQEGRLASIVTETDVLRCYLDGATKYESCLWRSFKVGEHMSKTVVTGKPTDHVMPTFHLMKEKHIRHLPIMEGGKLVGLISERDLRRTYGKEIAANLARDEPNLDLPIHYSLGDAMSRIVQTIDQKSTLAEAARRMVVGKIGALLVTENEDLLGIITETDLLRAFVEHGEK
jgi:CBS domain-containing protein